MISFYLSCSYFNILKWSGQPLVLSSTMQSKVSRLLGASTMYMKGISMRHGMSILTHMVVLNKPQSSQPNNSYNVYDAVVCGADTWRSYILHSQLLHRSHHPQYSFSHVKHTFQYYWSMSLLNIHHIHFFNSLYDLLHE